MVKEREIRVLDRSFPVQGMGTLEAGQKYTVRAGVAEYLVERMKSAVYCDAPVKKAAKKKAKKK